VNVIFDVIEDITNTYYDNIKNRKYKQKEVQDAEQSLFNSTDALPGKTGELAEEIAQDISEFSPDEEE
jgi:hypothetical protein